MEKLIDYFKANHEGKNWTLFLIILGLVHSAWFVEFVHHVGGWKWVLQMPVTYFEIGTKNPYFIFLEILFIASSITRILIAIDIFYIIETCPVLSDCITLLWKKRRDEWRRWKMWIWDNMQQMDLFKERFDNNESRVQFWKNILKNTYGCDDLFYLNSISIVQFNTQFNIVRNYDGTGYVAIPYHIEYWIKLEIKKCKKAIAEEQKEEAKNLSLTKQ